MARHPVVKTSLPKATVVKGRKRIAQQKKDGKPRKTIPAGVKGLFPASGGIGKTISRIKKRQRGG